VVAGVAALVFTGAIISMAAAPAGTSRAGGAPAGDLVAAASATPAPAASAVPGWGGGMNGGRGMGRGMFPGGGMGGGMGGGAWDAGDGWTFAGPGMGGMRGMRGGHSGAISVTAISGSSISLKTTDGWTRTITVTSDTKLTKAGATITTADIAVGDTVRFSETRNTDGTYAITAVEVVVPVVSGSVSAVSDTGFTIKGRDGVAQVVTVNASTTFALGSASGSKADVTVGADVTVAGPQATDGSITAIKVTIILPRVVGQVSATSSGGLTLTRPDGTTLKVNVSSTTTYQVVGKTSAALSDITAGMTVVVTGTQRADGSLDAVSVVGGSFDGWRGGGRRGNGASPAPSASPGTGTSG